MGKWISTGILATLAVLAIWLLGMRLGLLLALTLLIVVLPIVLFGARRGVLLSLVSTLIVLPLGMLAMIFYTELGVELLASQVHRLQRFGVQIEGVSGTLSGPLRVARFELDHPRVHIVSNNIVIQPQKRMLLLQTLAATSLTAGDTLVEIRRLRPGTGVAIERPARFLPNFLRVDVSDARFNNLRYVNINGLTIDAQQLAGSVRISPRRLTVRSFQVQAQQFAASGTAHLVAQRPLALELSTRGQLRMPRGQALQFSGDLGGTIDELTIKASSQRPSVVHTDLVLTRPNNSWRIAGKVSSPQVAFDPWLEKPPFTLNNVALDVSMGPDEIHAVGLAGIPEYRLLDMTVDARGRLEQRVLHLTSANIGLQDAPGNLHAAGTLTFDGGPPALDLATQWRDLQWPVRDTAVVNSQSGAATLQGPHPYLFSVGAQVNGPHIPAAQGTARGALSTQELLLTEYRMNTMDGSVSGTGTLQFAQPRAWTLAANAIDLNPGHLHREFPGTLRLDLQSRGTGLDKNASFAASIRSISGLLRGRPVRGGITAERNGKRWQVRDTSLQFGASTLTLDGVWSDTINARWELHSAALAELLPDSRGSIDFSGSLNGTAKAPHAVIDLEAENFIYQAWRAQRLVVRGDVDLANDNASRLLIEARQAGRVEPWVQSLRISGEGKPSDHRLNINVVGLEPVGTEAPSRAQATATASFLDGVWNATLNTTHLSNGEDDAVDIVEPAKVLVSQQRASLENFCLAFGAGRLCANGKWERDGRWEGTVAGYEIPLASTLPRSSADAEYGGRIEGRIHAFGAPGQAWQGEAGMRIIDAAIIYSPPGVEPETLQLGTGGLAATATPEQINFSFGVQAFTDTFLFANAQLDRESGKGLLQLPLRGDMRARAGDANILPLVFPEIDHAAGVLTANADITGTLAAPHVAGRLELAQGEFDSYRVNLALRDLGVVAEIAGNRLSFKGTGRAGEGRLDADGAFTWNEGASQGRLHIEGDNLLVADLPEYRVVASPTLDFLVDGQNINVAGDVVIPFARVQPVNLTGVVRASDDARFIDEHPAEREGRLTVHSEVRVAMGEDVRVDAFGLQGRIIGSVGVTTQSGEPGIGRGELGVEQGRYEAYGQKLDIARGRLLFETSPLDDPALDIEARRKVETVEVGLNVRGTLREPRLTFFSDPSMPQSQIASYLLVGKPLEQARSGDRTTVASATDALALQGGGLLASQVGRRFGIDEVGVESTVDTAGEANQALVLGKFLSPRLFVSYGISLTESINTLKLRYTLSDNWILRTEAGEHQSGDVEFTVER